MAPELNTRMEPEFRSGIVCLVGRPNVGKSTLLNRLVGKPVSITANKPQTTRNRIMGVRHGDGCQVVFVDTPGLHQAFSPLNRRMVGYALQALDDADLVVMVAEAGVGAAEEEGWVLERVLKAAAPKFLVLNKIDRVPEAAVLESLRRFGAMEAFSEWIPVSALTGRGVERLSCLIESRLQPGPPFFERDQITDQSEASLMAELVRQEVFRRTRQEVPYKTAVRVERIEEKKGRLIVHAVIVVERATQKGIMIGKGGEMLKSIGSEARKQIERLLGIPIHLALHVRVVSSWSEKAGTLTEMGYPEP